MREGLAKNLAEGIRKVSDETRLSVRQAEVVSVDTTAGVTASIDVDGVQIDDVVCFNNVVPAVGDSALEQSIFTLPIPVEIKAG